MIVKEIKKLWENGEYSLASELTERGPPVMGEFTNCCATNDTMP